MCLSVAIKTIPFTLKLSFLNILLNARKSKNNTDFTTANYLNHLLFFLLFIYSFIYRLFCIDNNNCMHVMVYKGRHKTVSDTIWNLFLFINLVQQQQTSHHYMDNLFYSYVLHCSFFYTLAHTRTLCILWLVWNQIETFTIAKKNTHNNRMSYSI